MPKRFMMLIIGLFFGAGGGFILAAANDATLTGHNHANHSATQHHDHSKTIEVSRPPPKLNATLTSDGPNAWNLYLDTENFRFAPENVNSAHVAGEGHAHIFIDDIKLARVYGPWFHVSNLPEDANELRVTLNANSHETLTVNGIPIDSIVSLDQ